MLRWQRAAVVGMILGLFALAVTLLAIPTRPLPPQQGGAAQAVVDAPIDVVATLELLDLAMGQAEMDGEIDAQPK